MLILSRRIKESLRIGDDILLTVLEVQGDVVRLGIEAPRGVTILREELYQQVSQENIAALKAKIIIEENTE